MFDGFPRFGCAFHAGKAAVVDFGDAGQGADALRVGFDGGAEFAHVVSQFVHVVGKGLEAVGQGFVEFREPIQAFVDGHLTFSVACSVVGGGDRAHAPELA